MARIIRSRKGITLVEVVICLAVVSILSTVIVSYIMQITVRTGANANNDAMRRDCTLIEIGVQQWLDAFAAESCDPDTSKLMFAGDALVGILPNGEHITVYTETVIAVAFDVMASDDNELLFCRVTCTYPKSGQEVDFSFCLSSRIGEKRGVTFDQTLAS